jgi:hypothetical protein
MEAENAIHRSDLGGLDEAGMGDCYRMQDTFERFPPEFQKRLQFWKIWAKIVVLPDVGRRYKMFAVVSPYPLTCF